MTRFDSANVQERGEQINESSGAFKCMIIWILNFEQLCSQLRLQQKIMECIHLPSLYGVTFKQGKVNKWGLVFEFVQGINLKQFVQKKKDGSDIITALRILKAIAKALECLHGVKSVHGQICFENIIVTKLGCVKLSYSWVLLQAKQMEKQRDLFQFGKIIYELFLGNSGANPTLSSLPWKLHKILKDCAQQEMCTRNATEIVQTIKDVQQAQVYLEEIYQGNSQQRPMVISNILDAAPFAIVSHLSIIEDITKYERSPARIRRFVDFARHLILEWRIMKYEELQDILQRLKQELRILGGLE
eukprot:TRINITY_DN43260_c0_g1_i2.p1 TRINITY_DN43260_c0_g1~~TRINITY_DN43260_c0_g1_i2.p1  ORF type:complete len:302 (-),score=40.57 TRINITY_DN43260_c0_g1_i2:349-1254(-)